MRRELCATAILAVCGVVAVGAQQNAAPSAPAPEYSIDAIRYATVKDFPLAGLIPGAPRDQHIDIAMVVWLVRGGGRTILFDSGFHRDRWVNSTQFHVADFLLPDQAVREAGVDPAQITDAIISHAHWDHMGGIDLFPNAKIWIQKAEYDYYTDGAWQPDARHGGVEPNGHHGGIDADDVLELVRRNTKGQVALVNGDDVEIFPGIRAYTGARHTFASQYIRVAGNPTFVLASDNCYLYENLKSHRPSATFDPADQAGNLAAQTRMIELAGSIDRVVPGHDMTQFDKFPTKGRVAHIK